MAETVLSEVRGRVLLITLNRPDARNAIDTSLAQGLLAAATRLDDDPGLTVGVIAGNGPGFSSGMDLKAFAKEGLPKGLIEFITNGTSKPLIAAVEGFALAGGLELALTCDLLVAGRSARLGISEARVGLFAAGGALLRLPRRLPYGVAMELALTAEPMSAIDAHGYGLVTRLADDGSAVDVAFELADRIACKKTHPSRSPPASSSSARPRAEPKPSSGTSRRRSSSRSSDRRTPKRGRALSPKSGPRSGLAAEPVRRRQTSAWPRIGASWPVRT